MKTKSEVAVIFRAHRVRLHLTQQELSDKFSELAGAIRGLKMHRQYIVAIESGEMKISLHRAKVFAQIFGCEPADLVATDDGITLAQSVDLGLFTDTIEYLRLKGIVPKDLRTFMEISEALKKLKSIEV